MGIIPEYLREINIQSVMLRFVLAAAFSGIIGINRGKRRRAAGLRTHLLVCVGAAAVMMVNQYTCEYIGYDGDIGRLGAQVISGIGFLGAGTILVTGKRHVSGLTSAAGLWASACMGLAVGIGFYEAALIMCVAIFIILCTLEKFDENYIKTSREFTIYAELDRDVPLSRIIKEIRKDGCRIGSLDRVEMNIASLNSFVFVLETANGDSEKDAVIDGLRNTEGVLFVEEF